MTLPIGRESPPGSRLMVQVRWREGFLAKDDPEKWLGERADVPSSEGTEAGQGRGEATEVDASYARAGTEAEGKGRGRASACSVGTCAADLPAASPGGDGAEKAGALVAERQEATLG